MNFRVCKITQSKTYKELSHNSYKVVGKYYVMLYKIDNNHYLAKSFQYGITASKKVGNAVQRNRSKRIIRVLINQINFPALQNTLFVNVIARKYSIGSSLKVLQTDFYTSMKKIISYEENFNQISN